MEIFPCLNFVDVLKDGYSFDQKATLKYSIKGCVCNGIEIKCRTCHLRERTSLLLLLESCLLTASHASI